MATTFPASSSSASSGGSRGSGNTGKPGQTRMRGVSMELKGELEYIVFHNADNGFTVARLRVEGEPRPVAVVGTMFEPSVGQTVIVTGEWADDPRWGEQFRAEACRLAVPTTLEGIRNYLASNLIKGVGPKYADLIVEKFGDKTIEVLDNDPDQLLKVKGIGRKRLDRIRASWAEHAEIRALMLFLQAHGVGAGYAMRIFKHYGSGALRVMRENPYLVCMDVRGFGFLTADAIARKLGFEPESELRARAGVLYALTRTTEQGHVFCPRSELVTRSKELLGVDNPDNIEAAIDFLAMEGRAVIEQGRMPGLPGMPDSGYPDDRAVYLAPFHVAETGIAQRLRTLAAAPKTARPVDVNQDIARVEQELGVDLAGKQVTAVHEAASGKVLVITGGPGTGKTTVIKAIIRMYGRAGAKILLAAPTGRAAKRMAEAAQHEAKTIHRMLEYNQASGGFCRNETEPLACSLLVVDEASMVDTVLMHHLLKAVPMGATLVLVGDIHQLPSVGPGNVLGDIIASELAPVVELDTIFRQAQTSDIVVNAHAINRGAVPDLSPPGDRDTDFFFVSRPDPEDAAAMVVEMVCERIPRKFGFDPLDDIQVLTPMHKGGVGAARLNERLQAALNPHGREVRRGERIYRVGDKVMQVRNNYDKDVFNGDIGRILELDDKASRAILTFDDREVAYDFADLEEIVPAYAVSIHKSQGSEYPAVVIPLLTQHYVLLQRNLLYTAVTRGKQLVVLIGATKAINIAIRNNTQRKRYTLLAERLAPRSGRG